jgi:hypothetical protein
VLVAAGVEQVRIDPGNTRSTPLDFISYPYSHSLLTLIVWGALFASFYLARPGGRRIAAILFALVVSHWVLDLITHRPDMPLYPGGPKLGLGLWNQPAAAKAVEMAMFAAGLWSYTRATSPRDKIGFWGFWSIMAFLFVGFLASDQPPPSVQALWLTAILLGALTIVWSWWADEHRTESRK